MRARTEKYSDQGGNEEAMTLGSVSPLLYSLSYKTTPEQAKGVMDLKSLHPLTSFKPESHYFWPKMYPWDPSQNIIAPCICPKYSFSCHCWSTDSSLRSTSTILGLSLGSFLTQLLTSSLRSSSVMTEIWASILSGTGSSQMCISHKRSPKLYTSSWKGFSLLECFRSLV